ncbi:MAG: methionyl-tRNA formyltransferase [Marinilabiliales bacterium]|nr:MAG: methionyl-tRNA formyltransferase [Marinilabiliales bacterium]
MTNQKPEIIFLGTAGFAVPSLEALINFGYPVKAVVTAPDRPAGRGLKIKESEIKKTALSLKLPVFQPSNLNDREFAEKLRAIGADIFIVVAFRKLPEIIWKIPPMGTVNLHASLLPYYRGAAPVNHAIINGEKVTGVTTFLIDKDIDTGKILLQEKTEISDNENAGQLHDRLMKIGAGLVIKTVDALMAGTADPVTQERNAPGNGFPAAPKISREYCRIDWNMPAGRIYNFVRGLSPWPAAWTTLVTGGNRTGVKIFEVEKGEGRINLSPGSVVQDDAELIIGTGDGFVSVKSLQLEGRRRMAAGQFLQGFRITDDAVCI